MTPVPEQQTNKLDQLAHISTYLATSAAVFNLCGRDFKYSDRARPASSLMPGGDTFTASGPCARTGGAREGQKMTYIAPYFISGPWIDKSSDGKAQSHAARGARGICKGSGKLTQCWVCDKFSRQPGGVSVVCCRRQGPGRIPPNKN